MSERDLVFFSYRHDKDGERWLKALRSMLEPYVLDQQLITWSDHDIRTGEQWHGRIQSAIERTRVAVLLVNQAFFGSTYIRQHELPRLVEDARAGHLTLVVVVVGFVDRGLMDAHGLSAFQATDSPDRPMNGLRGSNLDKALVAAAIKVREAYVAVCERGTVAAPMAHALRRGDAPALLPFETAPGPLLGVPQYDGTRFVARPDDIAVLREILVRGTELALGVTSAGPGLGLHGMGGMRKSVLALALCHDDAVRRTFTDGIAWVALGQTPDLLAVQNRLLRLLDSQTQPAETLAEASMRLRQTLQDRRALLVVDDVWDAEHALGLDVGQGRSRLLMTTRDATVLSLAGARIYSLQRLPQALARDLIALRARCGVRELPPEADEIIEHTRGLPLALALAGAQVADGVSWTTLVDELRQGHVDFLDHAYGSIYASLGRSVNALGTRHCERYLDLAVLPEDEAVPMTVVAPLWQLRGNLSAAQTEQLLVRLDRKALLTLTDNGAGRTVALHDLQLDFVRWRASIQPRSIGRCSTPTGPPKEPRRKAAGGPCCLQTPPISGRNWRCIYPPPV
ncbi:MAG TPA: NB-ARC domain-containing protein [Caldimonas sp.]|nr:NB-ARC domain-containing protein [Caldimonas sp.]HEX2542948.1 NB-ARC domain-containing protein [Caldimonas sp.]